MGRGKHLTETEKNDIIKLAMEEELKPQKIADKLGKSLKSVNKVLTDSININTTTNGTITYVVVKPKESRGRKRSLSPVTIKNRLKNIEIVVRKYKK